LRARRPDAALRRPVLLAAAAPTLMMFVFKKEECVDVATGTVKWFNAGGVWIYRARQRRQGCFRAHLGGRESWPHDLKEGAKVSYEEKENRGKTSAENLRVG